MTFLDFKSLMCMLLVLGLAHAPAIFAFEGLVPPNMGSFSTLTGPDINDNGVRDDVDAFIQSTYSRSVEVAAASQFARAVQAAVTAGADEPEKIKLISLQISRAVNCVYVSFGSAGGVSKPGAVIEQLRSMTTNTKERLGSYLAFAKSQDGTAHELPRGATCV